MYHINDPAVLEHRDLKKLVGLEVEDRPDGKQVAHMSWELDPAKHYDLGPDGQHQRPFAVRSTDGIEHTMHPVPDRQSIDPFGKMTDKAVEEAAEEEAREAATGEPADVPTEADEFATEGISDAAPDGGIPQPIQVGGVTIVPAPRPE